jgi:hypothetical protein
VDRELEATIDRLESELHRAQASEEQAAEELGRTRLVVNAARSFMASKRPQDEADAYFTLRNAIRVLDTHQEAV